MNLKITRPICWFDLETTGLSTKTDKIIEISIVKVNPDKSKVSYYSLVNPQMPIESSAIEVHGITQDKLNDAPTFDKIAKSVLEFINGCDLGGYNIHKFDVPLLMEEFLRCGILFDYKQIAILDVYKIFAKMEPRTLTGSYKHYTGKVLENAHEAEQDNLATMEIFEAQLEKYKDELPEDIKEIEKLTLENENFIDFDGKFIREDGQIKFNFGKHANKTVKEVFSEDSKYFDWIINKADFSRETKTVAKKILEKLNTPQLYK